MFLIRLECVEEAGLYVPEMWLVKLLKKGIFLVFYLPHTNTIQASV